MPGTALRTYRRLMTELRHLNSNGKLAKESPMPKYVAAQYRKYQTTDETLCKAREEMHFIGQTYLCYLESLRKHREIHQHYKGAGERTVDDTANIVGFKLPHDPK